MIELAPRHKIGFPVTNPVLLAGGTVGYGEAVHRGVDLAQLGGVVVGPISRYPQIGSEPPRLAETSGGFVLQTGLQNRGINAVVKKFAQSWRRLGCPVIAQIADTHPEDASVTARRLLDADGVMGLELLLAPHANGDDLAQLVRAIRRQNDLPLWVKLPLERAMAVAAVAAQSGVDGLVVGQPMQAATFNRQNKLVRGALHGPLSFAPMLAALLDVAQLNLPLSMIACGGIHTPAQARQVLSAGATALQLDSAIWLEPGLAEKMTRIMNDE